MQKSSMRCIVTNVMNYRELMSREETARYYFFWMLSFSNAKRNYITNLIIHSVVFLQNPHKQTLL
jgi:hypothetical protein